jgi:hypothetical protein
MNSSSYIFWFTWSYLRQASLMLGEKHPGLSTKSPIHLPPRDRHFITTTCRCSSVLIWLNVLVCWLFCISEVPVANFTPESSYPERLFRGVPAFLQGNAGMIPYIRPQPLPWTCILIRHSQLSLSLFPYNICSYKNFFICKYVSRGIIYWMFVN